MIFPEAFFEWIEKNRDSNPTRLRFRHYADIDKVWWMRIALAHIENIKKAGKKLISASGEDSLLPEVLYPSAAVEQSSSLYTASLHAEILGKNFPGRNLKILDLTCGLGIDTLAFARKGWEVTALEIDGTRAEIAAYNFRNIPNIKIVQADAVTFLERTGDRFDAVFVDPARRDGDGKRFFGIEDCAPNLYQLTPLLKEHTGFVLAKLSPMLDIRHTMETLDYVERIHVVGCQGECKELLAGINFEDATMTGPLDCIVELDEENVAGGFCFTYRQEESCRTLLRFGSGRIGSCLYLPSPVAMKAGCFATLADRFNLTEESSNSHLFFSESRFNGFPGKCYEIVDVLPWSSGNIKRFSKSYPEGEVSARNFPYTASELTRRLKIKPSGKLHFFATTSAKGEKLIYVTRPQR